MSAKNTQKGLGRNFDSLLPGNFDQSVLLDNKDRVQKLFITDIVADPNQPRKNFDEQALKELSQSIKKHGILQPLVVSPRDDKFVLVAGERRLRAAKMAGLKQLPAIIRTGKELERLEIGLVENVQRVDLSPIEQAVSIVKLHEQFNIPYEDIAVRLGKAKSTVLNIARLLQLPKKARQALEDDKISEGHARTILSLKDNVPAQNKLLEKIIKDGISVRQAEQFVINARADRDKQQAASKARSTKLHRQLSDKIGSKVTIVKRAKGGKIQIEFDSDDQLQRIIKSML